MLKKELIKENELLKKQLEHSRKICRIHSSYRVKASPLISGLIELVKAYEDSSDE
jgi:hypothetical protein